MIFRWRYNRPEMKKRNEFSYNTKVAQWWLQHSLDAAHRRAYRRIADFVRESWVREPGVIVDYACGPGNLLALLSLRFRRSKLVGLDGSEFLLSHAQKRFALLPRSCAARISLIETPLPNLGILKGKADLVMFCFPNMVSFPSNFPAARSLLSENDRRIAANLALAVAADGDAPLDCDAAANQTGLEQGRIISLNLRRLLVQGGICIRVEYATMKRHELAPLELSHVAFEEGSLDAPVDGQIPSLWFRLLASAFFRSGVLEDVYEQTGDERDKNGGYLITVLRAV
jgi:SAM-dependent methyltransferase